MPEPTLHQIAEAAGLLVDWVDASDQPQRVSDASLERVLAALGYPVASAAERREALDRLQSDAAAGETFSTATVGEAIALPFAADDGSLAQLELESGERRDVRLAPGSAPPVSEPGYHRLTLADRPIAIAVAPRSAFGIDDVAPDQRIWGSAAQVYALRSDRQLGFGDLGDVADAAGHLARYGADALAISPCHALFTAAPERYGPYGPSTRLALHPLYADPRTALERINAPAVFTDADDLIEWPRAGAAKLEWLRQLFDRFEQSAPQRDAFDDFAHRCGDSLVRHATFEALHAHFLMRHGVFAWRKWPAPYHHPSSPQVSKFAREHAAEVRFHLFLQWLATESIQSAQRAAIDAGMRIGLIADISVGVDPSGSQVWSQPDEMLQGLSVGAPPDALGPMGQDWGVTTFSPAGLRRAHFAGFIETLRANFVHGGGARIDHILGLRRLWVIPEGSSSRDGAYLRYPEQDLLRLLKLESHRAGTVIIGEDLGTVPAGFSEMLAEAGILGLRVLYFERDKAGQFRSPDEWHSAVAATTSTHDLPPVAGWWRGRDIDWRAQLGELRHPTSHARKERQSERENFWAAATSAGCAFGAPPDAPAAAVDAALDFVAATPSRLALVPLEDLLGLDEQPNLPGTDEHPNWRRRLPRDAFDQPQLKARAARLGAKRGRR